MSNVIPFPEPKPIEHMWCCNCGAPRDTQPAQCECGSFAWTTMPPFTLDPGKSWDFTVSGLGCTVSVTILRP